MPASTPLLAVFEHDFTAAALGASLFDASEDCIEIVGLDGALLAINANGARLLEIDDFEPMRGSPWAHMWPEPHRSAIETAVVHARAGRVSRFSAECATAKGTPKLWEVLVSPVFDPKGLPVQVVAVSRDITDRRRIEEENALLALELAHRIKNMFAVVDGVISMSARATPDANLFAAALRDRLSGLGRAITYVMPPEISGLDVGGRYTLHGLLHVLLAPYGDVEGSHRRVLIEGDDVPVGRSAATSVALFANELATNALKYGALSLPHGRVEVVIRTLDHCVDLTWSEQRTGDIAPGAIDAVAGFGATLLDNAIVRQLDGSLSREWAADGLIVRIRLSIDRLAR